MLAFSVVSVPAVAVHAQPNNGGDNPTFTGCKASTWAPGSLECTDEFGNTYLCSTSDGQTPENCVIFTQPAVTGASLAPDMVHPLIGGILPTGNSAATITPPSLPVRGFHTAP
jgi:hypothetical protein